MVVTNRLGVKINKAAERKEPMWRKDIGTEFSIEKCAMLEVEKGKIVKSVGIELLDGKVIKSLQEGESYKYLRIHNSNDNSQNMMLNNQ